MSVVSTDSRIQNIASQIEAGERVSYDDGIYLAEKADILTLGGLANLVRERKNGNYAYYNTNIHLNPTNVCVYRCVFCAFRSDLKAPKAYTFEADGIRQRVAEAEAMGATEIHVVGGLHHQKSFDWYVDVIRTIHEASPALHIKAWTAVEINWFSFLTKKPVRWVLEQMVAAGLGSMPGGGAEVFHSEVRDRICEHKADAQNWIDIHRTAHELGLRTNATMLYGHIEKPWHLVDHLCRLRELQDQTGGFQTFIPLAFHPDNTGLDHISKPSGLTDLSVMALSRIMLDNFDHIKAYWIMLGEKTAQVALSFGADDLDGTVIHELIYHDAGAKTPEGLTVEQIHRLIKEAGRIPMERDTLYRQVIREDNGTKWRVGEPIRALMRA